MFGKSKNHKYNATKTVIDGLKFDSKLESKFYEFLKSIEELEILELQPKINLQPKFKKNNVSYREINYVPDFLVEYKGKKFYIDSKGVKTADFKIKEKMFNYLYITKILIVCKSIKELAKLLSV
jgi:Protein of unknown function (DUF1064)